MRIVRLEHAVRFLCADFATVQQASQSRHIMRTKQVAD
jgi:hypothetical protein